MISNIKPFIISLAKEGGTISLNFLNKKKRIDYKKGHEIVTHIDRMIEKKLVNRIKSKFKDHNIIGEEFEYKKTNSKYAWVLDPIDGTINYARGFPHFCTSIALLKDDEPLYMATYDPIKNHLFYAEKGKGAFLNNKKIKVSNCKKIQEANVEVSESDKSDKTIKLISQIIKNGHRIRVLGSTALSLCYVAAGWIDARIKTTIGKYDVAGGALLIREAGGSVTNFKGKYWKISEHTSLLATNKYLKTKYLKLI